ncbi:MAG: glutathione S-transferase family protein [Pseudomonadota bacterium]
MKQIDSPIQVQGIHGSPYTRKMLAALRYRRLPYRFIINLPQNPDMPGNGSGRKELPKPKVALLPTVYLPDTDGSMQAITDSTPILRCLEAEVADRSIIPNDPVIAFLNYILEDYADEWLTRCMFHYRWSHDADIKKAGQILPLYLRVDVPPQMHEGLVHMVTKRQTERLPVVGSNDTTARVIEASYVRFLQLMETHLQSHPFLFGGRPASADFALMGQLTCLTHFDPTPMRLCEEHAPRVYAWVERLEDLSGYEVGEDDWFNANDPLPDSLLALLQEVSRTHMPQLLANGRAVLDGAEQFTTVIDGQEWTQPSFPYQLKCLKWIRDEYEALSEEDRDKASVVLTSSQLDPLVS